MSVGAFLVYWTLMIVAMMGPSLVPIVLLYLETTHLRTHGPYLVAHVGAFVIGYFLAWTAFGLPIFGLARLEGHFAATAPPVAHVAGAGVLAVAGFYQLTRFGHAVSRHVTRTWARMRTSGLRDTPCRQSERDRRMARIAWGHVADACWHSWSSV